MCSNPPALMDISMCSVEAAAAAHAVLLDAVGSGPHASVVSVYVCCAASIGNHLKQQQETAQQQEHTCMPHAHSHTSSTHACHTSDIQQVRLHHSMPMPCPTHAARAHSACVCVCSCSRDICCSCDAASPCMSRARPPRAVTHHICTCTCRRGDRYNTAPCTHTACTSMTDRQTCMGMCMGMCMLCA